MGNKELSAAIALVTGGLQWTMPVAEVGDLGAFTTDDNENLAYVRFDYFGGQSTILVDPEELAKFRPFRARPDQDEKILVSVSGQMSIKPKTGVAKFKVTTIDRVIL